LAHTFALANCRLLVGVSLLKELMIRLLVRRVGTGRRFSELALSAVKLLGPTCAPSVVKEMQARSEIHWDFPILLEHFCNRSPAVIDALRAEFASRLTDREPISKWLGCALASLGQHEFVVRYEQELGSETTLVCLIHPLTGWRSHQRDPTALDYALFEPFLASERHKTLLTELFSKESFGDIRAFEVPTAIKGAEHIFWGIRRHAAYVLGNIQLGMQYRKACVDALLPLLFDPNERVRLCAVTGLSQWSSSLELIEQLSRDDPCSTVREIAAQLLGFHLTGKFP